MQYEQLQVVYVQLSHTTNEELMQVSGVLTSNI